MSIDSRMLNFQYWKSNYYYEKKKKYEEIKNYKQTLNKDKYILKLSMY